MTRDELLRLLVEKITAINPPHPTRVALDGVDAAGKTTLADELAAPLAAAGRQVIRASVDGFHNPREARYRRGPDSHEGYFHDSFDYAALRSLLLEPLGPIGNRLYRTATFDYSADANRDIPMLRAAEDAILLFDGVFLLRPELVDCWDCKVFVDVSFETVLDRATHRDLDLFGGAAAVRLRYARRYIPGQQLYLATCRPHEVADMVIDNNDPHSPLLVVDRARHRTKE